MGDPLATLGAFVAELEAPDFDAGVWHDSERTGDTMTMPWFELSPRGAAFVAALAGIMIKGFDWMTWAVTPEAKGFKDDHRAIDSATTEQLARLATALVRQDRFSEGAHAEMFENGMMLAVARRAAALAAAEDDH
jgi:hypothetical protein